MGCAGGLMIQGKAKRGAEHQEAQQDAHALPRHLDDDLDKGERQMHAPGGGRSLGANAPHTGRNPA